MFCYLFFFLLICLFCCFWLVLFCCFSFVFCSVCFCFVLLFFHLYFLVLFCVLFMFFFFDDKEILKSWDKIWAKYFKITEKKKLSRIKGTISSVLLTPSFGSLEIRNNIQIFSLPIYLGALPVIVIKRCQNK